MIASDQKTTTCSRYWQRRPVPLFELPRLELPHWPIGHGLRVFLFHLQGTGHLAQAIPDQDVPALPWRMLCILHSLVHCAFPAHLDLALTSLIPGPQELLHLALPDMIFLLI